jgi:predicted phage terminase large subunit-like protein
MEFDQLETFTAKQFFYMLSRNRSMCGVAPYVRATCNPEPGWLADFLEWWIDDDGYARLDRSGQIRWMIRVQDRTYWADSPEELLTHHPNSRPKSVTFFVSTIFDNQQLLEADPDYLGNLEALDYVDRQRLLGDPQRGGNWKIKPSAGKVFNRDAVPDGGRVVRFWDFAGTEKKTVKDDPDFTASVKMKRLGDTYYILDSTAEQIAPSKADNYTKKKATDDGRGVAVRWEMEPGAAARRYAHNLVTFLAGWDARPVIPQGDKLMRAKGLAAQSEAGNVKLLRGPWNEAWLTHMHGQPDLPHDDTMDASSGAFNELVKPAVGGRAW